MRKSVRRDENQINRKAGEEPLVMWSSSQGSVCSWDDAVAKNDRQSVSLLHSNAH
jgi:hypothetical protein